MYVALAGVAALFRKEIPPFKKYTISSRILAWDRKWVFVVSHFVGGKDGREVYASCLSKYVFKSGRKTVPPETVFGESGLLPEKPEGAEGVEDGSGGSSGAETPLIGLREGKMGEEAMERAVERIVRDDLERKQGEQGEEYWTWERVEAERRRGLEIAKGMLAMDGLVDEYRDGTEEGLEKVGQFYGSW